MVPGRIAAAIGFWILCSMFMARPALAGAEAGQVLTLAGDCAAIVDGQRTTLKMGDAVHVGDLLEVGDGAKLKLRMNDGSIVSLGSGARMTIENYDVDPSGEHRDAKLGLDSGLLRAVVTSVRQPSKFEVDTATSVAAARSTDWFVEALPNATIVSVLDGEVVVEPRQQASAPAAAVVQPTTPIPQPATKRPGGVRPAPQNAIPPSGVIVPALSSTVIGAPRVPIKLQTWTRDEFDQLIARTRINYGWCQCTQELALIKASCEPSRPSCEAACSGSQSSFIPDAREACARYYTDVAATRARQR
jgi:hypothetical protein